MKILVICQHYYPEPFRITDICEEMAYRGHQVTVVTGTPNYPMGEIYPGYEKGRKSDEIINGVNVHRVKTAPRKTGTFNRLRNYFSFARWSKKYVNKLSGDFDVVFVNQLSPVMMAEAGVKYKKKFGTKLVLYCLDLWPESLCVGNVKKGSLVYKVFKRISKRIYRSADKLLITSSTFKKYLKDNFSIEDDKIEYLPQYAESQFLTIGEKVQTDEFRVLFAGNLGLAQSVDTIIDSARLLKDENIKFDIVGDGSELDNLKERAKDLQNVVFHGRKPLEDMPGFYENADAMLVTLKKSSAISFTLPGKVQSYMASGRVVVGAIDGETQTVLNASQGGYCGEAENARLLAINIKNLKESNQAVELGRKNREYYLKNFDKDTFIDKLIKSF